MTSIRFSDWTANTLTTKTTTIDGTEKIPVVNATGTTQAATLSNLIAYTLAANTLPQFAIKYANNTINYTSSGAFYLEAGGQTPGNARGAGAFDWQAIRGIGDAAMVASGTRSFAFGRGVTASGSESMAGVYYCTASGAQSIALGSYAQASATDSVAIGHKILAANKKQFAFGGGAGNYGQSQGSLQAFYTITTDATSTALNINNATTDRMVIPQKRLCTIYGLISAMYEANTNAYFCKSWEIKCAIKRDGGSNTAIVGNPIITLLASDNDSGSITPSTWNVSNIAANTTYNSLDITVNGQNSTNVRWQGTLLYSQVGF